MKGFQVACAPKSSGKHMIPRDLDDAGLDKVRVWKITGKKFKPHNKEEKNSQFQLNNRIEIKIQ